MRRELACAIATFAGFVLVAIVACGFPDPAVDDGTTDGSSSGGETSTGDADAGSTNDDSGPPLVCDDAECDCDKDGQRKKSPECGGLDCYDRDPLAKNGQPDFVTKKLPADFNGDWDCDGNVKKQFEGNVLLNCTAQLTEQLCVARKGFTGPQPGCGEQADFRGCKWTPGTPGTCSEGDLRMELQGCK